MTTNNTRRFMESERREQETITAAFAARDAAVKRECENCEEKQDADGFRYCDACGQTLCSSCQRYYRGCNCGAVLGGYLYE